MGHAERKPRILTAFALQFALVFTTRNCLRVGPPQRPTHDDITLRIFVCTRCATSANVDPPSSNVDESRGCSFSINKLYDCAKKCPAITAFSNTHTHIHIRPVFFYSPNSHSGLSRRSLRTGISDFFSTSVRCPIVFIGHPTAQMRYFSAIFDPRILESELFLVTLSRSHSPFDSSFFFSLSLSLSPSLLCCLPLCIGPGFYLVVFFPLQLMRDTPTMYIYIYRTVIPPALSPLSPESRCAVTFFGRAPEREEETEEIVVRVVFKIQARVVFALLFHLE